MPNLYPAKQILFADQTTSNIFNPQARFQIVLLIPDSGNHEWQLQIKSKRLSDEDTNWRTVQTSHFQDADGQSSGTFDGSAGFDYRLKNTIASPATGAVADWAHVGTKIYKD